MEPEGSLPHSQEPATCSYTEHINFLHTPAHLREIYFNVILPSAFGVLQVASFLQVDPTKTL
jgi:hypothetical protein